MFEFEFSLRKIVIEKGDKAKKSKGAFEHRVQGWERPGLRLELLRLMSHEGGRLKKWRIWTINRREQRILIE